jgi:hypothetical protein
MVQEPSRVEPNRAIVRANAESELPHRASGIWVIRPVNQCNAEPGPDGRRTPYCEDVMTTDPEATTTTEPATAVAVGGLLTVIFGTSAVLMAIGIGWVGAALLGVLLLVLARTVPVSSSATLLRYLMAAFGVVALLGATFDLLT